MFRLFCYEVLTGLLLQHADEAGTSVRVVFGHACHDHAWGQWGPRLGILFVQLRETARRRGK